MVTFNATGYNVIVTPITSRGLTGVVKDFYSDNQLNHYPVRDLMAEIGTSGKKATVCADARVPKNMPIAIAAIAGAREGIDNALTSGWVHASLDHGDEDGKSCGARGTSEKFRGRDTGNANYNDLVRIVDPVGRDNAIHGLAKRDGLPAQYIHTTGNIVYFEIPTTETRSLHRLLEGFSQEMQARIQHNQAEYGAYNSRGTDFNVQQNPLAHVIALTQGTFEHYAGKEGKCDDLGIAFQVKPWFLGTTPETADFRPIHLGSILYALDSRKDTMHGHPHGFQDMEDQLLLLPSGRNTTYDDTMAGIGRVMVSLINGEPALGAHYSTGTVSRITAMTINESGIIQPTMYQIAVNKA